MRKCLTVLKKKSNVQKKKNNNNNSKMDKNNPTGVNFWMVVTTSAMPENFICKVSEKYIQLFSRNGETYRETDKHTNQQTDISD